MHLSKTLGMARKVDKHLINAISIDVARIKRLIVHTGVIDLAGIYLQKTTIDTIDIAQASIPKINLRNVGISKAVIGGLALSSQCRN